MWIFWIQNGIRFWNSKPPKVPSVRGNRWKWERMEAGTTEYKKIFAFPRYIKKSSSAWWQILHGKWKKKDPGTNGHLGVPETAGLAQRSALLFYTYFAAQRRKFENGGCENSKSLKGSGRSGRWSARVPASHLRDFATARERNRTPGALDFATMAWQLSRSQGEANPVSGMQSRSPFGMLPVSGWP